MSQFSSLIRIASAFENSVHHHYRQTGLQYCPVPQVVGITGACENVDTLFRVGAHCGIPLFFSQTGQLALEQALAHVPGVFTTMISGRDEETEDNRHLRQFMLTEEEFDWSLVDTNAQYDEEKMYEALLSHIESSVKAICKGVIAEEGNAIASGWNRDVAAVSASLEQPFHRISYDDAVTMLQKEGFPEVKWGDDLGTKEEAKIVEVLAGSNMPRPVFIMKYPKDIKFFNMKVSMSDPRVVLSADLVFPYAGEGVGSAVREHDGAKLEARLRGSTMYRLHLERGGTIEDFGWYLRLVSSGNTKPHAGYGIGNERVIQYLLGAEDIRQCSVFSRMAATTGDWDPARKMQKAEAMA